MEDFIRLICIKFLGAETETRTLLSTGPFKRLALNPKGTFGKRKQLIFSQIL